MNNNDTVPNTTKPILSPLVPPVAELKAPESIFSRQYSTKERVLVLIAFAFALLFDRLVIVHTETLHAPFYLAIFWLSILIAFYVIFWKKLKSNKLSWVIGILAASLCIWNMLFDYAGNYGAATTLVIPAVVMAHMTFSMSDCELKDARAIVAAWFSGWLVKPFSRFPMIAAAAASVGSNKKKSVVKPIAVGVLCTLLLLAVLIPLLMTADLVFGYYLKQLTLGFDLGPFLIHGIITLLAAAAFYSFLWNLGNPKEKVVQAEIDPEKKPFQLDAIISCIVLGSVVLIYALFCIVQFTYLFAGAGLPEGVTYASYAREGFAQIIVICAINLLLFGVFLQYGRTKKAVSVLLSLLLLLSGIMLVSGFVRLRLYIEAYGLTWLRLLSSWFILYLAVVIVLSFIRMFKEKLPLIAASALTLLICYTALGYANPDAIIVRYNLRANDRSVMWVTENHRYVSALSHDAMLALLDEGVPAQTVRYVLHGSVQDIEGYNISSQRLRAALN